MLKRLLLAATAVTSIAAPAAAEKVVVTADRMLDVASGKMIDHPAIFIADDGRITGVADARKVRWGADVRHLDFAGKTLLPGLIDMHVHLTSLAEIGGYRAYEYTDQFWTAVGVANAKKTLDAGFTTVRNVGADGFGDVALRQAIDGGWVVGPRVVTATYLIGATGGHCDDNQLPPSLDKRGPAIVTGAEQAREKVRWLKKYGAQLIKICATGGVFSAGDQPGAQQLDADEIRAITDEAHSLGLKVAAHAHGDAGIRASIDNGVDTIEHASLASDATIADAKKHGTWFDMDIYDDDYILATGTSNGTSQESLDKEKALGLEQRQTFQRAVRAGVRMLFGTDAGVYPHGQNARQFAKMVEWGMTPLQAIQAATVNAAVALGKVGEVGVIAPGAWGDLIAVGGNPLANVRTLEKVEAVVKGGKLVSAAP